jgi:TRAP transporter 4TM/12TM fusion protein
LFYTSLAFIALAMFGGYLPGEFAARSIPLPRLAYYLVWDSSAILGVAMKIIATVVVVYIFFGQALFKAGGSTFFTGIAMALMGKYRGGPAKIAIVGSSLFGSISGNIVSNVMTVGTVTIPLMKRAGFRPHLAAAIEACASTAGQITPPVMGVAAFIMAEFLQVPFYEVALAAVIPALLFYVALFIQVDLEAARSNILPMPKEEVPRLREVLKEGWYFLLPLAALVYALFGLNYEPELAGLVATVIVLAIGVLVPSRGKRIGLRDLYAMLRDSGTTVLDLFMLGAAAGIMIGALNYSGVGFTLTLVLVLLAGGSLIALLVLSAVANIVLGLGLPTVGVYIVLATLVAPALVKEGIDPMAAHMFIMYYGCLSMISPPVAIAAFVAANLAGADPNRTGWVAMAFGWTLFVIPFLFVFSGTLLLKGDPLSIALDLALAIAGVWFISAAMMGYATRPLGLLARVLYCFAGIGIFMPQDALGAGRWINLSGAVLGVALLAWAKVVGRRAAATGGLGLP